MHPKAQALLDVQLSFIQQHLKQNETIAQEVLGFFDWFKQQYISSFWSSAQVNALLQEQILATPATTHLIEQIEQHIALALQHPHNANTTVEDVLPVETIDQIARYISSKTEHRHKLIKNMVNNPAYTQLLTNIVQQSIQDYLDNSMTKKIPGVGSFMKMGKAVVERATDSSLEDTLRSYLQKNIHKLSSLSEKLINLHFDDEKLYHLQAKIWHAIKKAPLSTLQNYVLIEDLPHTVSMGEKIWDHIRQTPYMQEQVSFGVNAWIERHQNETFEKLMKDLNIDTPLLRKELYDLVIPIIQHLVETDYLINRAREYLTEFYQSEAVPKILEAES